MKKEYDSKRFMKILSVVISIAIIAIITISTVIVLLSGGNKETENISFYFMNFQTNEWETEERAIEIIEPEKMAVNVLNELNAGPTGSGLSKSIPESVSVESIAMGQDKTLDVHFSEGYKELSATDSLNLRTSLVLTLTELSFIDNVRLFIGENEIIRSNGQPLGLLNKESFVTHDEKEVAVKELTLYFSDSDVLGLLAEKRVIEIESNKQMPTEQYVIQELIKGPADPDHYALIPPETKVISVKVDKSICYIDFSADFVNKFHGGSSAESLMISSIVNSLTELPKIQKVQFLIEGNKFHSETTTFSIDLTTPFERQEDLILSSGGK